MSAREELLEAKARLEVARATRDLAKMERQTRQIQESNILWDWMSGYQDLLDRMRTDEGRLLLAPSTTNDRRHGANWPFWRTWQEHAILRAQSRFLHTENDLAQGAISGLTSYVVGEGYQYRWQAKKGKQPPASLLDRLQEVTDEYARRHDLPSFEQELFKRSRVDGEYFTRDFIDPDDGWRTWTEPVEPEQVLDATGVRDESGNPLPIQSGSFGVVTRPGNVRRVTHYFVCYDGMASQGELVPASQMTHAKIGVVSTIKRGLPDFSYSTYEGLKIAGRCISAMTESAAIQASVAEILEYESATASDVQDFVDREADYQTPNPWTGTQSANRRVTPGESRHIPKGMKYVPPPYSNGLPAWSQAVSMSLRRAGVRWNAPEWLISGDASNNNYASSLTAESPFTRRCLRWQGFYKTRFGGNVERACRNAADAGEIRAEGRTWTWPEIVAMCELQVEAPSLTVRDELQESQCNQIKAQAGVLSIQTWAAKDGLDYDEQQQNIQEHQDRYGQQGQSLGLDDLPTAMESRLYTEQELLEAIQEAEAKRKPGEKWQGKSGRWFTLDSDGHVTPAKAPGAEGGDSEKTGGSNSKSAGTAVSKIGEDIVSAIDQGQIPKVPELADQAAKTLAASRSETDDAYGRVLPSIKDAWGGRLSEEELQAVEDFLGEDLGPYSSRLEQAFDAAEEAFDFSAAFAHGRNGKYLNAKRAARTLSNASTKLAKAERNFSRAIESALVDYGPDSPFMRNFGKSTPVKESADFDSAKHPRAADGKFGSGGGGSDKADSDPKQGEREKRGAELASRRKDLEAKRAELDAEGERLDGVAELIAAASQGSWNDHWKDRSTQTWQALDGLANAGLESEQDRAKFSENLQSLPALMAQEWSEYVDGITSQLDSTGMLSSKLALNTLKRKGAKAIESASSKLARQGEKLSKIGAKLGELRASAPPDPGEEPYIGDVFAQMHPDLDFDAPEFVAGNKEYDAADRETDKRSAAWERAQSKYDAHVEKIEALEEKYALAQDAYTEADGELASVRDEWIATVEEAATEALGQIETDHQEELDEHADADEKLGYEEDDLASDEAASEEEGEEDEDDDEP